MAVAVFTTDTVVGEAVAEAIDSGRGVRLHARFSVLPPGRHGFHIHQAGDLRGEGCAGAGLRGRSHVLLEGLSAWLHPPSPDPHGAPSPAGAVRSLPSDP